mmetsp:Transcript_50922/g.159113  ORF Transcript_50922/g.159113 Transcript_50922/m.159113 type:complete len:94 (-) Transcript_50922:1356-1637(-)
MSALASDTLSLIYLTLHVIMLIQRTRLLSMQSWTHPSSEIPSRWMSEISSLLRFLHPWQNLSDTVLSWNRSITQPNIAPASRFHLHVTVSSKS